MLATARRVYRLLRHPPTWGPVPSGAPDDCLRCCVAALLGRPTGAVPGGYLEYIRMAARWPVLPDWDLYLAKLASDLDAEGVRLEWTPWQRPDAPAYRRVVSLMLGEEIMLPRGVIWGPWEEPGPGVGGATIAAVYPLHQFGPFHAVLWQDGRIVWSPGTAEWMDTPVGVLGWLRVDRKRSWL